LETKVNTTVSPRYALNQALDVESEGTLTSVPVRRTVTSSLGGWETFNDMKRPTIVTTSWDDGDCYDVRVAQILRDRQIAGTFYVPITPHKEHPALSHAELRNLAAEGFEIGAHGFSHKLLWKASTEELSKEIVPCKPILEDIIGTEVRMFCYPKGRYDSNTVRILKEAGYWGARTNRMLATRFDFDRFAIPTTVQVSPHSKQDYVKNVLRAGKVEAMRLCLTHLTRLDNWVDLAKALFDSVLKNGGIWHLYGHSQEIESMGMWKDLEAILDYVSRREGVLYLPNSGLVRFSGARVHAGNGKL
jgi:peptidoglycan-N-acetylglucosamine deacetylase